MFGFEKLTAQMVGAGLLILALIGAIIGLINYGQKLGKAQVEVKRLKVELVKADEWKEKTLVFMKKQAEDIGKWQAVADAFEESYLIELGRAPDTHIVYREIAATVPEHIALGDSHRAAVDAWDVLEGAGLTGEGVPP